jgi:hypothetical protein
MLAHGSAVIVDIHVLLHQSEGLRVGRLALPSTMWRNLDAVTHVSAHVRGVRLSVGGEIVQQYGPVRAGRRSHGR